MASSTAIIRRPRTQMLRPKHFLGSTTALTERGLVFDHEIGHDDRYMEVLGDEELVARFADRRPSRCVINPRSPSARNLRSLFKSAQAALPDERIAVGYEMPNVYERAWSLDHEDECISEGQTLVMVAFDNGAPVGFATLRVSVYRFFDSTNISVCLSPSMVYVAPERRGQGYGMDMSVACGFVARALVEATYAAAPVDSAIRSTVQADYESEGGERFARHLFGSLEFAHEMLQDDGRRRVDLESVELDAAY